MHLEAQHIHFAYQPEKTVLNDVSLTLKAGETLYVLGRNGSGKTTLLACLAGLLQPKQGEVILDGKNLKVYSSAERARLIGLIPQIHTPAFSYTVKEMVMMGRAPHLRWLETPSQKDQKIVEESLDQVGISDLQGCSYTEISGGERQLVLIARGLAQKCSILLMDEPTAHLDLNNQYRVLEIIRQLNRQGLSFVISSHSPNDALTYADQVLLLSGGVVAKYGQPWETLTEELLSTVYGIQTEVIYESTNGVQIPRAVVPRNPSALTPESLIQPETILGVDALKDKDKSRLVIVTGMSGAGKTSWCARLVEIAKAQGLNIRGVLSPGIYKDGEKIGISIRNLATGEERQLAKLKDNDFDTLSTPRWAFDAEVLSWANNVLLEISESDLLIIDELGPLEFFRGKGLTAGLSLIDSGRFRIACVVIRSSLLPKVLQRWPDALVVHGYIDESQAK